MEKVSRVDKLLRGHFCIILSPLKTHRILSGTRPTCGNTLSSLPAFSVPTPRNLWHSATCRALPKMSQRYLSPGYDTRNRSVALINNCSPFPTCFAREAHSVVNGSAGAFTPAKEVRHSAPLAGLDLRGGGDCERSFHAAKGTWRDSICISVDSEDDLATPQNVDDLLFEMFKDEKENKVHMGTFLAALMETGLRKNDPRLQEMNDNLMEVHGQLENSSSTSVTSLRLDFNTFKKVIRDNIVLISRALRHKFVIPEWEDFCDQIEEFYQYCKTFEGGKVASYIPQLSRFSPNYWGVSVCSTDGQRISIGDTNVPFTVQSCSKPLTYAIALNELCSDTVHKYVGQEPSGRMFNAIVLDYNNKPHNPLVNAGSIVTNALLHSLVKPEMSSSEKFDFIQDYFRRMAGNESVGFSNGTFLSEREHADRNYALGYYMRENKCFPEKCDLMSSLDLYFQCCSMEVTAEGASVIAATLANGGICPITGEKVLQPNAVRDVLSLMHSCGMYDYSGQFAFKVGLPAKSGVCGAIMLVIPNVMGVCTWSPPLDSLGNSVRGIRFCERMVEVFNFHRYDNLRHAANKKDPRRQRYESRGRKVVSLLFSASAGDVTALRRSALSGMDMEESDYDGRTALHLAAIEGHIEAVHFLLYKCKVNPAPKDRWDRTPADDARASGYKEIEEMLGKATEEFIINGTKEVILESDEEKEKEKK